MSWLLVYTALVKVDTCAKSCWFAPSVLPTLYFSHKLRLSAGLTQTAVALGNPQPTSKLARRITWGLIIEYLSLQAKVMVFASKCAR